MPCHMAHVQGEGATPLGKVVRILNNQLQALSMLDDRTDALDARLKHLPAGRLLIAALYRAAQKGSCSPCMPSDQAVPVMAHTACVGLNGLHAGHQVAVSCLAGTQQHLISCRNNLFSLLAVLKASHMAWPNAAGVILLHYPISGLSMQDCSAGAMAFWHEPSSHGSRTSDAEEHLHGSAGWYYQQCRYFLTALTKG